MADELNDILARRAAPEAPSGLAARIIEASADRPHGRPAFALKTWLEATAQDFALPQAALAAAAVLVAGTGLYLGFSNLSQPSHQDDDWLLYVEETLYIDPWL